MKPNVVPALASICTLALHAFPAHSQGSDYIAHAIGHCYLASDPALNNDIVFRSAKTKTEAIEKLKADCMQDMRWGAYDHIAACPDGYFAAAYSFGYCGGKTMNAALLGLAKSFEKNASARQKADGLAEIVGNVQVGLFRHAKPTLGCYWVGSTPEARITARDPHHGTGQAHCAEYSEKNVVDGVEICSGNAACIPWIQREFAEPRPVP